MLMKITVSENKVSMTNSVDVVRLTRGPKLRMCAWFALLAACLQRRHVVLLHYQCM